MSLTITERDRKIIRKLKDRKVLVKIKPDELKELVDGSVLIGCADGDQYWDMYTHFSNIAMRHRHDHPRIHPLTLNGLPLHISTSSELEDIGEREVTLKHFFQALALKHVEIGLITNHVPCAVAYAHKRDALWVVRMTLEAEQVIKTRNPGQKNIRCFLHVDDSAKNGEKNTYFIDATHF